VERSTPTGGVPGDPSQLPETKETLKQYTSMPRGDIDGPNLNDGTQVKLPPHLTGQIARASRNLITAKHATVAASFAPLTSWARWSPISNRFEVIAMVNTTQQLARIKTD
jgi:hypothetical protein